MLALSHQREALREALRPGGSCSKSKGPTLADGVLTADGEVGDRRLAMSLSDSLASSSTHLEPEDDCRPANLYGKYTWKIANYSDMKNKELRSNAFTVGSYKWYILINPAGCDVCNHVSLFLCVADYDKLLPGWSHFAQFTIAVVNEDPKRSKYSDTLHRFTKKEHDWGWKRFMELSKLQDGFASMDDMLEIKAQVQVLREKPSAPFLCLDPQYRRELARVYLSNVEGICRRFVEGRRDQLQVLAEQLPVLQAFWAGLSVAERAALTTQRSDLILKGIVKQFFNDKEVTSTLVMDALFSGCQQAADGTADLNGRKSLPAIAADAEGQAYSLRGDVLMLLQTAATEDLPSALSDKVDPLGRAEAESEEVCDGATRDEQQLAELGRRTVEMYVLSHVFLEKIAVAFNEAESMRRQEALIREEEQHVAQSGIGASVKAAMGREQKARKKERRKARQEAERAEQPADAAGATIAACGRQLAGACHCQAAPAAEPAERRVAQAAGESARAARAGPVLSAGAVACCAGSEPAPGHSAQIGKHLPPQCLPVAGAASPAASVQSADCQHSFGGSNSGAPQSASQATLGSAATSSRCRMVDDEDDLQSSSSSVQQPPHPANLQAAAEVAELRARVAALEAQLRDRDETVAALRDELAAAVGGPPAPATPPPAGPSRRSRSAAAAADVLHSPDGASSPVALALRGGGGKQSLPMEHCSGGQNGFGGSESSSGSANIGGPSPGANGSTRSGRSSGGSPACSQSASCPGSRTGSCASSLDAVGNPELAAHFSCRALLPPISRASTGDLRLHSSSDSSSCGAPAERAASAGWEVPAARKQNSLASRLARGRGHKSSTGTGHAQQRQAAGQHAHAKQSGRTRSSPASQPSSRVLNGHTSAWELPAGQPANRLTSSQSAPTSYLRAALALPRANGAAVQISVRTPRLPAAIMGSIEADNGISNMTSEDSISSAVDSASAAAKAQPGRSTLPTSAPAPATAQPAVRPASTPLLHTSEKVGRTAQPESPRLDDFAHMGLITELLE